MLLGLPFFNNYYAIFNLNTTLTSVGLVATKYTLRNGMNIGSIVFILILTLIVIVSIIGCYVVYRGYKVKAEL